MSRTFANRFAFSHSSHELFKTCPRAWWWSRIGSWRGWERTRAGPDRADTRLAYQLKKMVTIPGASGTAVHQVAQEIVKGTLPAVPGADTAQRAILRYLGMMREAYRQAIDLEWIDDPKHKANLFEVYYADGRVTEKLQAAEEAGVSAVKNLAICQSIQRARRSKVLAVEELEQFDVVDVPVWVAPDLIVRDRRGLVFVTDFKSGRPWPEKDRAQIKVYACFLWLARSVPVERIRGSISYLALGREECFAFSQAELEQTLAGIIVGAREIRARLNTPAINAAPRERFPMTRDLSTCARCRFHHVCRGTRRIGS